MILIGKLIQYIFLTGFVSLLILYSLIIYAQRRAFLQTRVPLPFLARFLMIFCLLFILHGRFSDRVPRL